MKAVILAAGKGTRLAPYNSVIPKPLLPIGMNADGSFQTILERQIQQLSAAKISEIAIVVNYCAQQIKDYVHQLKLPLKIRFVNQSTLNGNGGAFYSAQKFLRGDDALIVDCDNFIADDLAFVKMIAYHRKKHADVTVGVGSVDNISKFAIMKVNKKGVPVDILEKPSSEKFGNIAKSGVMILSGKIASLPKKISKIPSGEYTTTQIINHCMQERMNVSLFKLKFSDIGTWEEYIPALRNRL